MVVVVVAAIVVVVVVIVVVSVVIVVIVVVVSCFLCLRLSFVPCFFMFVGTVWLLWVLGLFWIKQKTVSRTLVVC